MKHTLLLIPLILAACSSTPKHTESFDEQKAVEITESKPLELERGEPVRGYEPIISQDIYIADPEMEVDLTVADELQVSKSLPGVFSEADKAGDQPEEMCPHEEEATCSCGHHKMESVVVVPDQARLTKEQKEEGELRAGAKDSSKNPMPSCDEQCLSEDTECLAVCKKKQMPKPTIKKEWREEKGVYDKGLED